MTSTSVSRRTLTVRAPDDLLAVVPTVLGFWPQRSAVLLTFGARHAFHARVDLPGPHEPPEAAAAVAQMLLDPALCHRVGAVAVVVYDDAPGGSVAGHRVWQGLRDGFAQAGIPVVEALRVGEGRWYPLTGAARQREPGVPFDVGAHPFLVQSVLDGRVTHASREALADTLRPDPAAVAVLADALAARGWAAPDVDDPVAVLAEAEWAHDTVADLLDGPATDDARLGALDVARLLGSMRVIGVRDAVWAVMHRRDRLDAAVRLFTDLVRGAPDAWVPAPASLLAWSAWLRGDGALAWCAVDRCHAADPDYTLAGLVAEALVRAIPPTTAMTDFDWRSHLVAAAAHAPHGGCGGE